MNAKVAVEEFDDGVVCGVVGVPSINLYGMSPGSIVPSEDPSLGIYPPQENLSLSRSVLNTGMCDDGGVFFRNPGCVQFQSVSVAVKELVDGDGLFGGGVSDDCNLGCMQSKAGSVVDGLLDGGGVRESGVCGRSVDDGGIGSPMGVSVTIRGEPQPKTKRGKYVSPSRQKFLAAKARRPVESASPISLANPSVAHVPAVSGKSTWQPVSRLSLQSTGRTTAAPVLLSTGSGGGGLSMLCSVSDGDNHYPFDRGKEETTTHDVQAAEVTNHVAELEKLVSRLVNTQVDALKKDMENRMQTEMKGRLKEFADCMKEKDLQIAALQRQVVELRGSCFDILQKERVCFEKTVNTRLEEIERQLSVCVDYTIAQGTDIRRVDSVVKRTKKRLSKIESASEQESSLLYDFRLGILETRAQLRAEQHAMAQHGQFYHGQFLEQSDVWQRTDCDLRIDGAILAMCIYPACVYDIGWTLTSSPERIAKEDYMRQMPCLQDYPWMLTTLWQYRIPTTILRPALADLPDDIGVYLQDVFFAHCVVLRRHALPSTSRYSLQSRSCGNASPSKTTTAAPVLMYTGSPGVDDDDSYYDSDSTYD